MPVMTRIRNVPERQRAQVPGGAEAHHALANLGRQKDAGRYSAGWPAHDAACSSPCRCGTPIATPGSRALCRSSGRRFKGMFRSSEYCSGRDIGGAIDHQVAFVAYPGLEPGSGLGAGPSIFSPVRLKLLPWQGQAMMPRSWFHAVRQPRWVHTALSAK